MKGQFVRDSLGRVLNSSEAWPSIDEKLMSRVVKAPNGCWEFSGGCTSHGYGYIYWNGKRLGAHRVSYEMHCGPIPEGKLVLHKCDNPKCVRPDHLFIGDYQDNVDDMIAKGRGCLIGERSNNHKLTNKSVGRIKGLLAQGRFSQREIAKLFGVSPTTISFINTGQKWGHVPVSWRRWIGELPKAAPKPAEQEPFMVRRR